MKTLYLIPLFFVFIIPYSCSELVSKKEKKKIENNTIEISKSTMEAISLGTTETLKRKIKEINNFENIDSLISWLNNTMILNENFKFDSDEMNNNDRVFTYKGFRIYKLDKKKEMILMR